MRERLDIQQELTISKYREPTNPTLEESPSEKLPGARISPSRIENLSSIFEQYNEAKDKDLFFKEILNKEPIDKEKTLENAKWAVYGTLMHCLKYFLNVFSKTADLKRLPTEKDFRAVFPNKKDYYYESLIKILDLTIKRNGIDKDPIINAMNFWSEWRRNGQNFTPKGHKNYLIDPTDIRYLWENHTIPSEDIDLFKLSYENRKIETPGSTLLMNESFLLLNIYFPDCNFQVPTFIDEIQIPRQVEGESIKPIKIIDYKTGKQFKEPDFRGKVQIFLMTLSVYIKMMEKRGDIDYSSSQWDVIHSRNSLQLPRFRKKSLLEGKGLISSLHASDIPEIGELMKKYVTFSYVNPLTQKELKIDLDDIFLRDEEETRRILGYMNRLTMFYIEHKDILKLKLSGKTSPYALPTFPKEGFLEGGDPLFQDSPQLALNI